MPEMTKVRRAVVISPDAYNARQRLPHNQTGPGLCIVVPVSATPTLPTPAYHVPMLMARYRALTKDGWAKCNFPLTVSHNRLHRPRVGGIMTSDIVSKADMALIQAAVRLVADL